MTIKELRDICEEHSSGNYGYVYIKVFDEEGEPVFYDITGFELFTDVEMKTSITLIGYPE